jgi:DNA topoisomerase I
MDGLTAKVFRTYNASKTLQDQLDLLTNSKVNASEKVLAYNRANRQVALLCNHQRSVPKTFEKSMETLRAKVTDARCSLRSSSSFSSDRCKEGGSKRTKSRTEASESRAQELAKPNIRKVTRLKQTNLS